MRPVDGIAGSSGVRLGFERRPRVDAAGENAPREPGRAIVPLQPVYRNETVTMPARRADAGFLAHLIATRHGFPQTRERRRLEPDAVVAAYDKALFVAPSEGRLLAVTR